MELDFETVRALSSPTRIRILNEVLEKDTTTTDISNSLGKTKSTVSSHLSKLNEAGLVEKDQKDGRRRVIYRPTTKAEDIIEGKERTVRFSLGSSAVSALAGVAIGYQGLKSFFSVKTAYAADKAQAQSANTMTVMENAPKADSAGQAAGSMAESTGLLQFSSEVMLFLGVGLLTLSVLTFLYGFTLRKLSSKE
ncbi:MAG: ArsR/SmtB family transcription factor [Candidatus Aenigmatarchaeota archaeon]